MFAADTLSIAVMELVDNGVMVVIPGAMDAGLVNPIFCGFDHARAQPPRSSPPTPVNRYLLTKGKGTPAPMQYHGDHGDQGDSHDHSDSHSAPNQHHQGAAAEPYPSHHQH